ncbi:NAD(P)/FAD-dependent oxidoreductase [Streptomyces sp. HNM0574]|uniref:NAD(P)/FAD-dependent oxidoreductase n=1 Tax=Streptomyces sp. HNM0574 TaxID=2714954 RepID=UPI00146A97C8|nr:NAD(P)/FAD-dependent oxidoreductase [Streptomyces sp. HNM0574]NLU67339.1 FAD-dependent oxidoreductase [Streptomyces sp. HNM0574]
MASPQHAVVLMDPDPLRRARLAEVFTEWYGDQFALVLTGDEADVGRARTALGEQGTSTALIAAVADGGEPPAALTATGTPADGTGTEPARVWLAPDGVGGEDQAGAAGESDEGLPRLSFTGRRPADLNIPALDEELCRWWKRLPEAAQRRLPMARIEGHFRSPRAFEARAFLAGSGVLFCWQESKDRETVRIWPPLATDPLVNPSLARLAVAFKLVDEPEQDWLDVVVVGGGPAGLSAAVYAGTEGLKALVLEDDVPGGQAGTTSEIANFFGFPDGVSGFDLARRALTQARKYGVTWQPAHPATQLTPGTAEKPHTVWLDGKSYRAGAVILAGGLTWSRLRPEVENKLVGSGVYYHALTSDAPSTKGSQVAIVGGGNSAGQAALHFARYAEHVTLLIRGKNIRDKMSSYLVDRIEAQPSKITVSTETEVTKCLPDDKGELAELEIKTRGKPGRLKVSWLYVLIGGKPNTAWFSGAVKKESFLSAVNGTVLTGSHLPGDIERLAEVVKKAREEGTKKGLTGEALRKFVEEKAARARNSSTQTGIPGIYAIGDLQYGNPARVGAAVGQGSAVIAELFGYIAQHPDLFPTFKLPDRETGSPA